MGAHLTKVIRGRQQNPDADDDSDEDERRQNAGDADVPS